MRPALIAATLAALLAGTAAAQPVATGDAARDDAVQAALQAPRAQTPPPPPVTPGPSLSVGTAPQKVFDAEEENRRIDAFINGPDRPERAGRRGAELASDPRADAPPCDETPHGEVSVGVGGGGRGFGYGGGGTVVMPIDRCHGEVMLSVSGSRFGR